MGPKWVQNGLQNGSQNRALSEKRKWPFSSNLLPENEESAEVTTELNSSHNPTPFLASRDLYSSLENDYSKLALSKSKDGKR